MRNRTGYSAVARLVGAVAAVAGAGVPAATAGSYEFTRLADASGVVQQFQSTGAALSDNGKIAFVAALDDQDIAVVRVGGGTETVIATTSQFSAFSGDPDINDAGLVGFMAQVVIEETIRPGVYVGDGDSITVVGAPNPDAYGDNFNFFELDAVGRVLMGELAPNSVPLGLAVGDGGPVGHLYDGNDDFADNDAIFMGDLTDSGVVSAIAGPQVGLRWTIWQGDLSASAPLCIAGGQEFNTGFEALAVNDHGDIAFIASHFSGEIETGVYLWTGGPAGCDDDDDESYLEIAHQRDVFWLFDAASGPAVNNASTVVFRATLDDGSHGLYTGSDPSADKVVATGDALDGSIVVHTAMNRFGLNEAGAIAFYALLEDGREGIYLATPGVPCPGDIDGSGAVDFADILAILSAWGSPGGPEDLDGSGTVDFGDVLVVLGAWGPCR